MYPYYQAQQQIIKVTGEQGARAYNLPANSSALLLDATQPLVWLKQTDGAGYPTLTAYKITPFTPEPAPDLTDVLDRIKRLEDKVNVKSDTIST